MRRANGLDGRWWRVTCDVGVRTGDVDASRDDVRFDGLVLTPGASGRATQAGLVAIDEVLAAQGVEVLRTEFPGQTAGRRRPDPPDVCIATVRAAAEALAARLCVPLSRVAVGGRSFGGRMSSMAVAGGLDAAALVLVSYPLHPPGRPEQLRTAHFPELSCPCLFVSGRRDAFAAPEELQLATEEIPGEVTIAFVDGDHSLRRAERAAADLVATWTAGEPLDDAVR